jgi:hypothetical protein
MAALNAATPGAFGVAPTQNTPQRRAALAEVKQLALKVLEAQDPPVLAQVNVLESRCPDEGCPDLETTLLIFRDDGSPQLQVRVARPIELEGERRVGSEHIRRKLTRRRGGGLTLWLLRRQPREATRWVQLLRFCALCK